MKNNETGRSMVEMLGVLAIIGVLSVGGIAGYTMAMNKYRANEILNAASQMVILARAYNGGVGLDATTDVAGKTNANFGLPDPVSGVTLTVTGSSDTYTVTVSGADTAVCKAVNASKTSLFTITCPETAQTQQQGG